MSSVGTKSGGKKRRGSGFTRVPVKSKVSLEGPALGRPQKVVSVSQLGEPLLQSCGGEQVPLHVHEARINQLGAAFV